MASNEAVYHHLIPKTYMKPWCFSGDSVWTYDKNNPKSEHRNINNICGIKYYYSIKAGSLYSNQDALDKIWGFLLPYQISLNGKILKTTKEMNENFNQFDYWEIENTNGININKRERNIIKQKINQSKDNYIEEQWNIQFENDWEDVSKVLYEKIKLIKADRSILLTNKDAFTIMKYIVMFDWRSVVGNKQVEDALSLIEDILNFSKINIPQEDRIYSSDKTVLDEIRHAYLLKSFYEFLSGFGPMQLTLESYEENLTYIFMLTSGEDKLITSDNPSFMFKNVDGFNEHVFVALPNLLISLAKKDKEQLDAYKVAYLSSEEVKKYNQIIFENATMILSNKRLIPNNFDFLKR